MSRVYSTSKEGARTHRGEYVEFYSQPISAKYAQVYHGAERVALPQAFVQQQRGRLVAFTGYEIDLVRTSWDGEESVPNSDWYTHHHNTYLLADDVNWRIFGNIINTTSLKSNQIASVKPNQIYYMADGTGADQVDADHGGGDRAERSIFGACRAWNGGHRWGKTR